MKPVFAGAIILKVNFSSKKNTLLQILMQVIYF
jgi:hypothetical protein